MRILILSDKIPPENRGGAGIVTWRLAHQHHKNGHDVHVIASTQNEPFQEIREDIPTYHIYANYPERFHAWLSLYNPQVNQPLRDLYQQIKPDVINAHNIHSHLTYHSMQIAHEMGIPVVFSSHDVMPFAYHKMSYFIKCDKCSVDNPDEYRLPSFFNMRQMRFRYNPLRNITIRRILTNYTQSRTAPSQELCNAHQANDLPNFDCVHNGIDVNSFTASSESIEGLKNHLHLEGRKVVLFAGRLTSAKGTTQLLDAMQILVKKLPELCLLVLSSVPIENQIQDKQYEQLRDKHVISAGWLEGEELAGAFHLSDVIVTPSVIFDTFPTVNLEAMASKTVVLASCFGGSREVVIDGETGYIINPFDTDYFAGKLQKVLENDSLRQTMADKAFSRVTELFTIEQQSQKMLSHYQNAIDSL